MSAADLVFVALPIAVLWALARDREERALALVLVIGARAALALGALEFVPPSQVVEMLETTGGDLGRLMQHERWGVWWPRWIFTWPAVAMPPLERSFALWSAAVLPVEAFLAYRAATLAAAGVRARFALGLVIGAAVMAVAALMNGRLIVAHTGMALILVAQSAALRDRAFAPWTWPALVLGTLMGHMTTGAGLVAYSQAVGGALAVGALGARTTRAAALFSAALTIALGPLLFGDVWKNLTFFEFDAIALLRHGPGDALLRYPILALGALLLGVAAARARRWQSPTGARSPPASRSRSRPRAASSAGRRSRWGCPRASSSSRRARPPARTGRSARSI